MSMQIITNARIVMAESVVYGSVIIENGIIQEIKEGDFSGVGLDVDGDFVTPGIVDMHTDNLERHFFPRPNIDWDPVSAAIAHDGVCIASGVTTVFDSFSLGSWNKSEARGLTNLRRLLGGVDTARASGALRADHFVHWRCELPAPHLPELVDEFMAHPMTRLASLMDHTPGQRQYRDLEFFLNRNWRSELDEGEVAERLAQRRENQFTVH
jgi:alpha-D-ribose 1-methylphosphonate 5-triphosphate diphosphatase